MAKVMESLVYSRQYDNETGFEPQSHPDDVSAVLSRAVIVQPEFMYPSIKISVGMNTVRIKEIRQHQILLGFDEGSEEMSLSSYQDKQSSHDHVPAVSINHPDIQEMLQVHSPGSLSDLYFIYQGLVFTNTPTSHRVQPLTENTSYTHQDHRIYKYTQLIHSTHDQKAIAHYREEIKKIQELTS